MDSSTFVVHWHDEHQPVYSVDFQPHPGASPRLATGGGDNNVRMWKLVYGDSASLTKVEYLSTLKKHTQAVNVVRFDPRGDILASAGDDGSLILWTHSDHVVKEFGSDYDDAESWIVKHVFRSSTSEIYDLSWSPNLKYIATGSMDSITRIYNVHTGQQVFQLADHGHYIQGIAWDPQNEFLATQSADRSVHIYSLKNGNEILLVPTLFFKIIRSEIPVVKLSSIESVKPAEPSTPQKMSPPSHYTSVKSPMPQVKTLTNDTLPAVQPLSPDSKRQKKSAFLYHSETLQSFFRRLAFSPDGSLLLTPLGIYKGSADDEEDSTNTVFVYIRSGLNKSPVCHVPGLKKPAIAISFSPIYYEVDSDSPVFKIPYKMVFAIATQDSIIVYDTVSVKPLGVVSNLHYSTITDLCWNKDGQSIIISSVDGFCSMVAFKEGLFGPQYDKQKTDAKSQADNNRASPEEDRTPIKAEIRAQSPKGKQCDQDKPKEQLKRTSSEIDLHAKAAGTDVKPIDISNLIRKKKLKNDQLQAQQGKAVQIEITKSSQASQKPETKVEPDAQAPIVDLSKFMAAPIVDLSENE